jgi:polysaccharide biosynthesis transport protein
MGSSIGRARSASVEAGPESEVEWSGMMQRMKDDGDRSLEVVHIDRRRCAAASIPDAADQESSERNMHFRQVLGVLRRYWKFVLGITVAGTALAGAIAFLVPPSYTAKAEIMVDPQQADAVGGSSGGAGRAADEVAIAVDTQVSMLSSPSHLRRALDSFSREDDPRTAIFRADPKSADGKPFDPALAMDQLERRLNVLQLRRSRVISIGFTAKDPQTAAVVANRIADLHITSTVEARRFQIAQEMAQLAARATELEAEMKQTAGTLQRLAAHPSAGANEPQPDTVKREEMAAGEAYTRVLRRQKELREQLESITPEAHILSRAAAPDRPSSPSPLLFLLPALLISALCGGTLAVLRERLDTKIRSEQDVIEALAIPCIALVPQLRRSDRKGAFPSCLRDAFTPYTEAIRSAAASLRLVEAGSPSVTLLISSSVPEEGKTTFAMSLATYLARLGRRTIIVDFDFRRPSILRDLHGPAERPVRDLADFPTSKLIRRLPDIDVDYLPIPRSSTDPLSLFAAAHLNVLQRQLRERYDCILIDGAPVFGVTETRLLRALADKTVFIVKWGSTSREVAQNALNILCGPSETTAGRALDTTAVVTQVDLKRHAKYRYGDSVETYVKYKKYYGPSAAA